jgi:hypothetical protein
VKKPSRPLIRIIWPYSDDNVEFAKALKKLGVIDSYRVIRKDDNVELCVKRPVATIGFEDLIKQFEMALGMIPDKETLEDIWETAFNNIEGGRVVKHDEKECIIEAT